MFHKCSTKSVVIMCGCATCFNCGHSKFGLFVSSPGARPWRRAALSPDEGAGRRGWDGERYPFCRRRNRANPAMNLLFDSLGPDARSVEVSAALNALAAVDETERGAVYTRPEVVAAILDLCGYTADRPLHQLCLLEPSRSEEHTSELQSLMRLSYAVFCLK